MIAFGKRVLSRGGALVVFGVLLRLMVLALRYDQLNVDTDAYLAIAKCLMNGDGFCSVPGQATAFRPPLYPLLVAGCLSTVGPLGIGLMQVACGGLTIWFTFQLARRLGLADWLAGLASLVVAVDPLLLNYTPQAMTEILMTTLVSAYLWSISDPRRFAPQGALAGALFGLGALCRPTLWAFGAFLLAVLVSGWVWQRRVNERRVSNGPAAKHWPLAFVAALAVVVAPWVVRNWLVFGHPILTTTHGGYTLALANNSAYFADVVEQPFGKVWSSDKLERWQADLEQELERRGIPRSDEVGRDRAQRDIGLDWIRSHPAHFLRSAFHRERLLWSPVPQVTAGLSQVVVFLTGAWYVLVFLAAFIGISNCRGVSVVWASLLVLIVSTTALHAVYWSNARMRAPLTPVLAIFAATGAQKAGHSINTRRRLTSDK